MKLVNFLTSFSDFDCLNCPFCGCLYLRHNEITVYNRYEDQEDTVITNIDNHRTTVELAASSDTGNPSPRRHGLTIIFSCKGCGREDIEMHIAQDKGNTYIGWDS